MSRAQYLLDGRFTDRLREAGAFEGMAPDTPPKTIYKGLKYKRALELEERRDQAQTLIGALVAFTQGGEYLDIAGHLYPPGFKDESDRKKRELKAMNDSVTILERFRAISDSWED